MSPGGGEAAAYQAALGLAWLSESGCHSVLRLLGREGPEAVWFAPRRRLLDWGLTTRAATGYEEKRRSFVAAEAEAVLLREGVRFLPFGAAEYPRELGQLPFPPAGLFVRGEEDALQRVRGRPSRDHRGYSSSDGSGAESDGGVRLGFRSARHRGRERDGSRSRRPSP